MDICLLGDATSIYRAVDVGSGLWFYSHQKLNLECFSAVDGNNCAGVGIQK